MTLLQSEAFKTLGGSAIKVYLVIGLYSDFGTDWASAEHPDDRPPGLGLEPADRARGGIERVAVSGLLADHGTVPRGGRPPTGSSRQAAGPKSAAGCRVEPRRAGSGAAGERVKDRSKIF